MLFAEKFAIIYTELPEHIKVKKTNDKYDSKIMEKAWKTTFLKWEELYQRDKYKIDNIYVIYADGYDYNITIHGQTIDVRYTPMRYGKDHISLRKTPANGDNLDLLINSVKNKLKTDDDLLVFDYNATGDKFILIESFMEDNK